MAETALGGGAVNPSLGATFAIHGKRPPLRAVIGLLNQSPLNQRFQAGFNNIQPFVEDAVFNRDRH